MIHKLKIENNYLKNLVSGKKKSEIRINDRDFQLGDTLKYENPDYNNTEKNSVDIEFFLFEITHIHSGLGMMFNYVSLSVRMLED